VDWDDELIDPNKPRKGFAETQDRLPQDFAGMILENLRSAGVQQPRLWPQDSPSPGSPKRWKSSSAR
jgi:hypothetical protein